ncbi:MAG: FKBP-type peptidyl-prolyl cis-trans isomerase [Ferruginibacter sp.]
MRKFSFLFILTVTVLAACKTPFKKGLEGTEYKIISNGGKESLTTGKFLQAHMARYYTTANGDSLLSDTRNDGGPIIMPFDSLSIPPEFFTVLKQMKKGDSAVLRIIIDSLMKKNPFGLPESFKKGHYLLTTLKLDNIYESPDVADSATKAEAELVTKRKEKQAVEQVKTDEKLLADFFAKNKIKPQKTAEGTYVEIIQPGTGPLIDTSVVVTANYTGSVLNGKVFDSNTDTSFHHTEPLPVNMTNDMSLGSPVIKGWTDGLKLLNKGAKAKLYIPSHLAYGPMSRGENLPPNSVLVFDMEVLDILSKAQAKATIEEKRQKMQEEQNQYMDSVKKVKIDTSNKK